MDKTVGGDGIVVETIYVYVLQPTIVASHVR